jgi:hypothetical protein
MEEPIHKTLKMVGPADCLIQNKTQIKDHKGDQQKKTEVDFFWVFRFGLTHVAG